MKKLLIIIMLFSALTQAQESIEFSLFQNTNLTDSNKDILTPSLLFRFDMQGYQKYIGYLVIGWELEHVKLQDGDYTRYSANIGYTFNKWSKKLESNVSLNYGMIDRWGKSFLSLSGNTSLSYRLNDHIKVKSLISITDRRDKGFKYGDRANYTISNTTLDCNVLIGLSYQL